MLNMINLWTTGINKMMLWTTEINKAYLWSTVIFDNTWANVTVTDNVFPNYNNSWWMNTSIWIKFTTKYRLKLWTVTRAGVWNNVYCHLKDNSWNILKTVWPFSWQYVNTINFDNYVLQSWTTYRIEISWNMDVSWSIQSFPLNRTHINWISASENWSDTWSNITSWRQYGIRSIETTR